MPIKKKRPKRKNQRTCHNCDHCVYIGDGDHLCDLNNEIVIDGWEPTKEFCYCRRKEHVE